MVVSLFVAGALLELGGILTIAFDIRDTSAAMKKRAEQLPSLMAATKSVIADWIADATGAWTTTRRGWAVFALVVGLLIQTAANLAALSL